MVVAVRAAPLHALCGEPAAQLRDDAVHRREVGGRAARQRAVELAERARGRQLAGTLDLRALELAPQDRLEAPQRLLRQPLAARVARRILRLGVAAQPERAADPLHVDADHARVLARAPDRREREPREVRHAPLVAVGERARDLCAQLLQVDRAPVAVTLAARAGPAALAHPLLDRGGLGRAVQEALEHEVEHAAVLGRLGERRRERLAEHRALAPVDLPERREGVEQLGGADRDALRAQLVGEREQTLVEAHGRAVRPTTAAPGRPAPRPARCRCGA